MSSPAARSAEEGYVAGLTVRGAFVPPCVPRCMCVARAFAWATCWRGGNLMRFVVVAMVVAEEV